MVQRTLRGVLSLETLRFPNSRTKTPVEKLFAQLLKRQAERVMQDVNECAAVAMPVNLARVRDLRELIQLAINHEMIEQHEAVVSGRQLMYPCTVGDFLALLEQTRQHHRAPAYLNQNETTLGQINHKIDLLAGLIAKGGVVPAPFQNLDGEEERV